MFEEPMRILILLLIFFPITAFSQTPDGIKDMLRKLEGEELELAVESELEKLNNFDDFISTHELMKEYIYSFFRLTRTIKQKQLLPVKGDELEGYKHTSWISQTIGAGNRMSNIYLYVLLQESDKLSLQIELAEYRKTDIEEIKLFIHKKNEIDQRLFNEMAGRINSEE